MAFPFYPMASPPPPPHHVILVKISICFFLIIVILHLAIFLFPSEMDMGKIKKLLINTPWPWCYTTWSTNTIMFKIKHIHFGVSHILSITVGIHSEQNMCIKAVWSQYTIKTIRFADKVCVKARPFLNEMVMNMFVTDTYYYHMCVCVFDYIHKCKDLLYNNNWIFFYFIGPRFCNFIFGQY